MYVAMVIGGKWEELLKFISSSSHFPHSHSAAVFLEPELLSNKFHVAIVNEMRPLTDEETRSVFEKLCK